MVKIINKIKNFVFMSKVHFNKVLLLNKGNVL